MTHSQPAIPEFIRAKREAIYAIAARYGISQIRLFGSQLYGSTSPSSDIDFLVHFDVTKAKSGFDFFTCQEEFEKLLNRKVDLVSDRGVSPYMAPFILSEAKML